MVQTNFVVRWCCQPLHEPAVRQGKYREMSYTVLFFGAVALLWWCELGEFVSCVTYHPTTAKQPLCVRVSNLLRGCAGACPYPRLCFFAAAVWLLSRIAEPLCSFCKFGLIRSLQWRIWCGSPASFCTLKFIFPHWKNLFEITENSGQADAQVNHSQKFLAAPLWSCFSVTARRGNEFCRQLFRGTQKPPGLRREERCQQVKGGDPSPLLSTGETCPECCIQRWAPQYKRDVGVLGAAQQRAAHTMEVLEHLS